MYLKNKSKRNKKGGFNSKGRRTTKKTKTQSKKARKMRKMNNALKSLFPFVVNK